MILHSDLDLEDSKPIFFCLQDINLDGDRLQHKQITVLGIQLTEKTLQGADTIANKQNSPLMSESGNVPSRRNFCWAQIIQQTNIIVWDNRSHIMCKFSWKETTQAGQKPYRKQISVITVQDDKSHKMCQISFEQTTQQNCSAVFQYHTQLTNTRIWQHASQIMSKFSWSRLHYKHTAQSSDIQVISQSQNMTSASKFCRICTQPMETTWVPISQNLLLGSNFYSGQTLQQSHMTAQPRQTHRMCLHHVKSN